MTMCVNIGHGDERVIEAMVEQCARASVHRASDGEQSPRAGIETCGGRFTTESVNKSLVHAWRRGCQRECDQISARIYESLQNFGALPFVSWRDSRRNGCDRRPEGVAWEPMLMQGVVHFLDPYRYRPRSIEETQIFRRRVYARLSQSS